ncbi:tetratricopeptide repeat-containing protein [Nitrospira sp. M1]
MHAFIVRPFGTKNGINFDRVDQELIRPALQKSGYSGGTTGEFIQQGNIRTDMFEQLLIADIVIADISIHNANAFYELGIRHAFRDKRTFLLKSKGDDVPFDLKTDRYMLYDADDPTASLETLVNALKATWDSQAQDSPVFQLLPGLEPTDHTKFLVVPTEFREEVEQAQYLKSLGNLQLLAAEVDGFAWKTTGLRLIGEAQFALKDWIGAKITWETIRKYDDMDLQANTLLGTIFQRQGNLVQSDQALKRALENAAISGKEHAADRAEILALRGRNAKILWDKDWQETEGIEAIQKAALASPHLHRSFKLYNEGFIEDRNHFYSGLNALAMLTIITELATAQVSVWEDDFDTADEAALKLKKLQALRHDLGAGVQLAIESKQTALARETETDLWAEISFADLTLLTSPKPSRVGRAYQKALANAPDFARSAARSQALLYKRLGILKENTQAAMESIMKEKEHSPITEDVPHVILFTGHRIDAEGRKSPRFPREKEAQGRAMIKEALMKEKEKNKGTFLGISGCASGGDILFHEVCKELDIPSQIYLAIPQNAYMKASVADAGPQWVERFNALLKTQSIEMLSDFNELPRWLRAKKDYNIWQRSNLWMLHNALAISQNNLTLLALWNGEPGDDAGGTEDMVKRVKERGAHFIHLDTRKLLK